MAARIEEGGASAPPFDLSATIGKRVVKLPTAQRRKVQQPWDARGRATYAAFKRENPWPGEYRFPGERDAERMAKAINSVRRSPELAIMLAIVGTMGRDQRAKVMMTLNEMAARDGADGPSTIAANLMAATLLTVGEQCDLNRALDRQKDES